MSSPGHDAIVDAYDRDGYGVVRDVLDAELVAEADGHVRWLQARHPELRGEDLSHRLVADDPFWVRLVGDERLLDLASHFVGADVALFASHYIVKAAGNGLPVLWHQDGAYWPLEPMRVVSFWLAVDPATPENGCLRVIPGSHRGDLAALRERADTASVLGSESDVDVDETCAVDIVMAPGDVEVHHPNLLHGSHPNTSAHRRCGLTIRYIPTSTRILGAEQPFPSALHLRGARGVNAYQPHPVYRPGEHYPFRGAA